MDRTAGTPQSFEERFTRLAQVGYRVGFRLVGDRAEAEDLAQEALARAFASWRTVARYDEAWVARVTTNLAIGRWRRRRRLTVDHLGDDVAVAVDVDEGGASLERIALVAALRSLPRRQREVVALRYLADLPEAEVAASLGITPGTVKQHAHRGLAALRRALDERRRPAPAPEREDVRDVRAPG